MKHTTAKVFRKEYEEVIMNSKNLLEIIQQDKATQYNIQMNIAELSQQISYQQNELEQMKQELESDLNENLPLQYRSQEIIRQIDKRVIVEIRSYQNPPWLALQILQLLIYLIYDKKDAAWKDILRIMSHPAKSLDEMLAFDLTSISSHKLNNIRQQFQLIDGQRTRMILQFVHYVYQYLANAIQFSSRYQIIEPKKQRFEQQTREFDKLLADLRFKEAQLNELTKLLSMNEDKYNQLMKYLIANSADYQIKKTQTIAFQNLEKLTQLLDSKIQRIKFKLQTLNQYIIVKNVLEITQYLASSTLTQLFAKFLPEYKLNEYQVFKKKLKNLNQSKQQDYKIYDPHKLYQYLSATKEQTHFTDELSAQINLNLSIEGVCQLYQQYTYNNNHEQAKLLFNNSLKSQLKQIQIIFNDNQNQQQFIEQTIFEEISKFQVDLDEPVTLQTKDQLAPYVCAEIYFNLKHKNFHSLDLANFILAQNERLWMVQMINYSCQFENLEVLLDMRIEGYQQNQLWKYCLKDYPQFTVQQKETAVQAYLKAHQMLDLKSFQLYQYFDEFTKNLSYYQEQIEIFEQEYQQSCELQQQMDEYNQRICKLQQLQQKYKEKLIELDEQKTELEALKEKKLKLESDTQFEENQMNQNQQKAAEMEKKLKIREIKLTLKDCHEVTRINDPDHTTYEILCLLMNMIKSQATWVSIKTELSSAKKLNEITNIQIENISQDFINQYEKLKQQISIKDIQNSKSVIGLLHIYKFLGQIHQLYFLNIEKNKTIEFWKNHEIQMNSLINETKQNQTKRDILQKLIRENNTEITDLDKQITNEKFVQKQLDENRDIENNIKKDIQEFSTRIKQLKSQINHLAAYCQSYELFNPVSCICLNQVLDTRAIPLFFYGFTASSNISIDFYLAQQLQISQQANQFQSFYLLYSLLKSFLLQWKQDQDGVDKHYLRLFSDNNKNIIINSNKNQSLQYKWLNKYFVIGFNTIFLLVHEYKIAKETTFPLLQELFEDKENKKTGLEVKSRFLNNLINQSIALVQNDSQCKLLILISYLVILVQDRNQDLLQQSNISEQMHNLYQIDYSCESLDQLKMQINDIFIKENIDELII